MHRVSKPTAASVQAQIDTHEAVCSERWKETILRIKRIEHIMIGTAGTTIVLLIGLIVNA
jgi:predicted nucleic acid-binding Zn ribbon protein